MLLSIFIELDLPIFDPDRNSDLPSSGVLAFLRKKKFRIGVCFLRRIYHDYFSRCQDQGAHIQERPRKASANK